VLFRHELQLMKDHNSLQHRVVKFDKNTNEN